jgi:hypothetical protein
MVVREVVWSEVSGIGRTKERSIRRIVGQRDRHALSRSGTASLKPVSIEAARAGSKDTGKVLLNAA